jgi:plastocyanin
MDRRLATRTLLAGSAALAAWPLTGLADDKHDHDAEGDDDRLAVTVSFGAGLNTAQPGNAANHHVLPKRIKVKRGGVVNFVVAGFHQPMVYFPGVTPATIALPPASQLFINDNNNLYYRGIAPAGGPPPGTPATANPANGANRVESVSFAEPGDYLVICNVRPHFVDGMWAIVQVR